MEKQYIKIDNIEDFDKLNEKITWLRSTFHKEYESNDFPLYFKLKPIKGYTWFSQSSIEDYGVDDDDIKDMKNSISVEEYLNEQNMSKIIDKQ